MKRLIYFIILASFIFLNVSENTIYAKGWKKKNTVKSKIIPKKKSYVYMVDDFSDGTYLKNPKWWDFGNLFLSIHNNERKSEKYLGRKSLGLQGIADSWFIGGLGTYLGIDMLQFQKIKLVVYSPDYDSGIIKIELFDDDNMNWQIDMDEDNTRLISDDIFAYNLLVDWKGWKVIAIPLSKFEDANPNIGDDIWNPYHLRGSGGLIQMQLVLFTPKEQKGEIDLKIDSIKFVN